MLICGDFETTGFDPDKDAPLELGLVLVTDDFETVIADREILFRYEHAELKELKASCVDFVRDMHARNGLWAALEKGDGIDPVALDQDLYQWAYGHSCNGHWPTSSMSMRPRLAGFNPGFDMRWLRRYAPSFVQDKIHYGPFDVSTLRTIAQAKYPTNWGPSDPGRHRGVADCYAAIAYARWFRNNVMSPYNPARGDG